jgi:hypothetical protein
MIGQPPGAATRLTLDVDSNTRPISGWLSDDTRRWEFSGWIELAAALQNALESRKQPPSRR